MTKLHSFKKTFRHSFVITAATLGLLASVVAVPVASAVSYSDPIQTGYWDYQDYSLSNPNDVGVQGADITPDGSLIVMAENKRSRIRIINSSTGAFVRTVTVGAEPWEVVINSTGSFVWVMNQWDNSISKVQISTGAVTTPITTVCPQGARGMRNMVLTPNDQYLVVSCAGQWSDAGTSVKIISLSDYSVTSVSNGSNPLIRLAMSPIGNYVYASTKWGQVTSPGSPITQIAIPSGAITSTFSVQTSAGSTTADGPSFININGAGDTLYVASNNGVFSAWNNLGASPTKLWSTYLGNGGLGDVGGATPFVVDRTRNLGYIVYQNQGGLWPEVLDVYDLTTGIRSIRIPIQHQWSVSITLSDDGETLISSGWRFSNMYKYRVGQAILSAQTVTWSPNTSLSVGSSPRTPSSLASSNGNGAITYSVVSAGATSCSVASVTGVITYSTAGNCTIRATASATGSYSVGTTDVTFVITTPTTTTTTTTTTTSTTTLAPTTTTTTTSTTTLAPATTTTLAPTATTTLAPATTVAQGQVSVATIAPTTTTIAVAGSAPQPTTTLAPATTSTPSTTSSTTVVATTTPSTSTTTVPDRVRNATIDTPVVAQVAAGQTAVQVDGVATKAVVSRENNTMVVKAASLKATLSGVDKAGNQLALDSDGNVRLDADGVIKVSVSGFKPQSLVDVWLFSTPTKLGSVVVGADGTIDGLFTLPVGVKAGSHRVVISSKSTNGKPTTLTFGVLIGEMSHASSVTRVLIAIPIALAVGVGLVMPTQYRRRKRRQIFA